MNIEFTSTLSMVVVTADEESNLVRLHAPLFVWSEHPPEAVALDGIIKPIFYVDDSFDGDQESAWLLRGATEAACEEAWSVYADIVAAGVPQSHARFLLPMCLMSHGTARMSSQDLKDFVVRAADHPVKEVGVIAAGYERLLAEG